MENQININIDVFMRTAVILVIFHKCKRKIY